MRARWTVNLLLLIVVALLSFTVRRELEQDRRVPTLTELAPETISEIRLERPDAPLIELLNDTEGWRMESPYPVAANSTRIEQLVRIAATQVLRSMAEGGAAERLGLEPASALLSLDGLILRFGDTEPIDHHRYVAVGGLVHLIGDGFRHHLMASAEDYVSPRLLPQDFVPTAGSLNGEALDDPQLQELTRLTAERVVALGEKEIEGRLLRLSESKDGRNLRLLVSADGRRWTRLDLRLVYELAEPPLWVPAAEETSPAADEPSANDGRAETWP